MDFSRNTVPEFHFSSALAVNANKIIQIGTADTDFREVRITDMKISCGGTARTVKLYVSSYSNYGKPLELDLPANSVTNLTWQTPYRMHVLASSGETRRLVASTDGSGVKYSISGYMEKL